MKELKNSWLIQRLKKPYKGSMNNPFTFGCGFKNGGLSDGFMKSLSQIFSFDYMGSAEFEFGALPEFFKRVEKGIKSYFTWQITINQTEIYVIAQEQLKDQINQRLIDIAENTGHFKEYPGLRIAVGLDTWITKKECPLIGWLEMSNDFMFFTDKTAFDQMAMLFGIKKHSV
jgi:hypothetical protein